MNVKKVMILGAAIMCSGSLQVSARELSADSGVEKQGGNTALNCIIDVESYKASYKDLQKAFGDNDSAYIEHYLTKGVFEGRKKGVLFDPLAYAEAYGDIKAAYGNDITAIVNHYVNYGMAEERTLGTANGYKDIATAEENGVPVIAVQRSGSKTNNTKTNSSKAGGSEENGSETGSYSAAAPAANYGENTRSGAVNANPSADYGYAENTQGSQSDNAATAENNRKYHHTTSIYTNDESTLLRVEYYDDNNKLFEYSSVENYDKETKSYTETVYQYDNETQTQTVVRTDTYVNGELVSSQ